MARKFLHIRSRNQITLPREIVSHLDVGEGDYLQIEVAPGGKAQIAAARLATVGTPEAAQQDREAEEEIKLGQYRTFRDSASFARSLRGDQSETPLPLPRSIEEIERELIAAILRDTNWNTERAAEKIGWTPSRFSRKLRKFKFTPEPVK